MIDLHYWTKPNGHKVTIFLEEARLPYRTIPVDIGAGDQFKPHFLAIALGRKDRAGSPSDTRRKYEVLQWLFWQMAGLGPMAGQNHHFVQ